MDPIAEIETRMQRYPHVQYRRIATGLQIFPPNQGGFPIAIEQNLSPAKWLVTLGAAMHIHVDGSEQTLELVAFALSDSCRLRETRRGALICKVHLEQLSIDSWSMIEEWGLLVFPFWRKATETIYQNNLIKSAGGDNGTNKDS